MLEQKNRSVAKIISKGVRFGIIVSLQLLDLEYLSIVRPNYMLNHIQAQINIGPDGVFLSISLGLCRTILVQENQSGLLLPVS